MTSGCTRVPLLAVLVLLVLLSGCGTKFIYNSLDWLVPNRVQDYLDLDRSQRQDLRQRVDRVLLWHRRQALPGYATTLEQSARHFADGVNGAELEALLQAMEGWWFAFLEQGAAEAGAVLYLLDERQLNHLAAQLEEQNQEWLDEAAELGPAGQQAEWVEQMEDVLKLAVGRLDQQQMALLRRTSKTLDHSPKAWIGYRRLYQADLLQLLREHPDQAEFQARFLAQARSYRDWYTPEYREQMAVQQDVLRGLVLELDELLQPKQRQHLVDWLQGLADDFRELSVEKP